MRWRACAGAACCVAAAVACLTLAVHPSVEVNGANALCRIACVRLHRVAHGTEGGTNCGLERRHFRRRCSRYLRWCERWLLGWSSRRRSRRLNGWNPRRHTRRCKSRRFRWQRRRHAARSERGVFRRCLCWYGGGERRWDSRRCLRGIRRGDCVTPSDRTIVAHCSNCAIATASASSSAAPIASSSTSNFERASAKSSSKGAPSVGGVAAAMAWR